MALVSPGVEVTVTDSSFFIPVSAPTVPLFFIATEDEKTQADSSAPAEGTFESGVVRTVTSVDQSLRLYGVPNFLEDSGSGEQHHGDARNEYGLLALNQFLGAGNRAFVVRANVNLNDNLEDLQDLWDSKIEESSVVAENLINEFINEFNDANGFLPSDNDYKETVTGSELVSLIEEATAPWLDPDDGQFNFKNVYEEFIEDQSGDPLDVFGDGFNDPATGEFEGITHIAENISQFSSYPGGGTVSGEFTADEGADLLKTAGDNFKLTQEFLNQTSLGSNDASRRSTIVTQLQAAINGTTEVRSESFDFNLVATPGYPETAAEMLSLVSDIRDEALVVADTPVNKNTDQLTNPSNGWAVSTDRQNSVHVAYYYPWALQSNIDGKNVVGAPSGIALRTYANNDNTADLWFAPAGLRRGLITGISDLGYVTGTLGGPTTFNSLALNQGQRDALYQDSDSGRINPLVFFPGDGFVVWGQKTSAPSPSAMDRVNVSRLIKFIKRQLRRNTLSFVFQPNDQLTRDNLKAAVDGFLGDLIVKRALYDFATVSDESNNTPDRIDRNEMYIDVALKPVKAAEFIFIPIRVVNTGAEFDF